MASRVVQIMRIPAGRQDRIYTESKKSIGSVMTRTGEVANGLTFDEVKTIMPSIVNADPSEHNFRQKVDDYFKSLTLRPDKISGLKLEVGVDSKGFPLNPMQYVQYKFAIQNPKVAENPESIKHSISMFVVEDKEKELVEKDQMLEKRRQAYKEYIKLLDEKSKLNTVLTLLATDLGYGVMEIKTADIREVKIKLEEYVQSNPTRFYDLVKDKNLEIRGFIEDCISAGALNRVGTAILNGDQKLGNTTEEAILFFKDKANSEVFVTLKERVAEYKKSN